MTGLAMTLLAAFVIGAIGPGARHAPEIVFFDDFLGASLDRSKWNVELLRFPYNNEQETYVDSPETCRIVHGVEAQGATNGALEITPRFREGAAVQGNRRLDFLSARLTTQGKAEFTYGTIAARMKLTAGQGLWPAFWMLGNGSWPESGEADIMENVGEANLVTQAMHGPGYSGDTPLHNAVHLPADDDITHWHVYSVDWRPDGMTFKVDGRPVYTATKAMAQKYGRWAFDNRKFLILNFAVGGGFPQGVNHIASPYPGVSQSTVDLIKAGKAKLLVDWVKVTKG